MDKRLLGALLACLMVAAACTTSVGDLAGEPDSAPSDVSDVSDASQDPAEEGEQAEASQDGEGVEATEGDQTAGDDTTAGFSVLGSLALIPASAAAQATSALQVAVADVDAAADQARLRRPLDLADPDDLLEFWGPLTGFDPNDRPMRVFVPLALVVRDRVIVDAQEFIDEVGFSPGSISSFIALETPPADFAVFGGVAVRNDLPEVAPGVRTIGEGDDLSIDPPNRSASRPLGRPLRVAEQGSLVALSRTTPPVIDWLEGSGPTLADDPGLVGLAMQLDEQRVVSAYLFSGIAQGPPRVGLGWRADDRGPQGVIVIGYDAESDAATALDTVTARFAGDSVFTDEPIADLVELDEIRVSGREIVATVDFAMDRSPQVILDMFIQGDGPFSSS